MLFEVFDCFLPLFYIAFYQLNVVALRRELVGLFWGDEIRRLITESLVPYVTEKSHVWKIKREYAKAKKDTDEKPFIPSQVVMQEPNNDVIVNNHNGSFSKHVSCDLMCVQCLASRCGYRQWIQQFT